MHSDTFKKALEGAARLLEASTYYNTFTGQWQYRLESAIELAAISLSSSTDWADEADYIAYKVAGPIVAQQITDFCSIYRSHVNFSNEELALALRFTASTWDTVRADS